VMRSSLGLSFEDPDTPYYCVRWFIRALSFKPALAWSYRGVSKNVKSSMVVYDWNKDIKTSAICLVLIAKE